MPGLPQDPYRLPCWRESWPTRRTLMLGGCQQHYRASENGITKWRNTMPEPPERQTACSGGVLIDENCYVEITAGATAGAAIADGAVTEVNLTSAPNPANNYYTHAPLVTFSGGGGTGAKATAVLSGDSVASFDVTSGGTGYTSAPTVTVEIPKWNLAECDKSRSWKAVSAQKYMHGVWPLNSWDWGLGTPQGVPVSVTTQVITYEDGDVAVLSVDAYSACSTVARTNPALYMQHVMEGFATYKTWVNGTLDRDERYDRKRGMKVNPISGLLSMPDACYVEDGDYADADATAYGTLSYIWAIGDSRGARDEHTVLNRTSLITFLSMASGSIDTSYMRLDPAAELRPLDGQSGQSVRQRWIYQDGTYLYSLDVEVEYGDNPRFFHSYQTYDGTTLLYKAEYKAECGEDTATFSFLTEGGDATSYTETYVEVAATLSDARYVIPGEGETALDKALADMLKEWDLSDDKIYPWVKSHYGDHPHLYTDEIQGAVMPLLANYNTPPPTSTGQPYIVDSTSFFDPATTNGTAWRWDETALEWQDGAHPTGTIYGKPAIPATGELGDRHYWLEAPNGTSTPGAWNTSITGLPRTATRWLAFDPLNCPGYIYCTAGAHSQHLTSGLRFMQKMVWAIPILPSLNYGRPCGADRDLMLPDGEDCSETPRFPDAWPICGRVAVASIRHEADGDLPGKTVLLSGTAPYLRAGDAVDFTTYAPTTFAETLTTEDIEVDTIAADKLSFTYTDATAPTGTHIKSRGAPHFKWCDDQPKGEHIRCETTLSGRGTAEPVAECDTGCQQPSPCSPLIVGFSPNTDTEDWPDNAEIYPMVSAAADTTCGDYWQGLIYAGQVDPHHDQDGDCQPILRSVESRCEAPDGATLPTGVTIGCGVGQLAPALLDGEVGI